MMRMVGERFGESVGVDVGGIGGVIVRWERRLLWLLVDALVTGRI